MKSIAALGTITIVSLVLASGCCPKADPRQSLRIVDVTKTNLVLLSLATNQPTEVSRLYAEFYGYIDGVALIACAGAPTQAVSGVVTSQISIDITGTNYFIHYIPHGVTTGALTVTYMFY